MKKVILLNSSSISKKKDHMQITFPHLRSGIASMASFLRGDDMSVSILDPNVDRLGLEELTKKILTDAPDYLSIPAYTEEINDAAKRATEIKKDKSDIVTIIGGHHLSAIPSETLEELCSLFLKRWNLI